MKCIWSKTASGHKTECGHSTRNKDSRNFIYCPFCGHEIMKNRYDYQHEYYMAKKGKHQHIGVCT